MDKKFLDKAKKDIKKDEGFRKKMYRCTAGKWTIGYGTNLEDMVMTEEQATFFLNNDIESAVKDLKRKFRDWEIFSDSRKSALVNMRYNLGNPRFNKFVKMIKAINSFNWVLASQEAMNSEWAGQVGNRANRIAKMLREGN